MQTEYFAASIIAVISMLLSSLSMLRVAVCTPELRVADCEFNVKHIAAAIDAAAQNQCFFVVFPELAVTGHSCADLFFQPTLLQAAQNALADIAYATSLFNSTAVVGAPIELGGKIFNCAVVVSNGEIVGIIPKSYLPNSGEYYERRWFASADATAETEIRWNNNRIPFGTDVLFRDRKRSNLLIGIEICEDLWSIVPPSCLQAQYGATILVNCSASVEIIGKKAYRQSLVAQQSARCMAAYLYASSGSGESTTDVVYSGHQIIAENGNTLAEAQHFGFETELTFADIDIGTLIAERTKNSSYITQKPTKNFRIVDITLREEDVPSILNLPSKMPFLPSDKEKKAEICREIISLQTAGLAKRLRHIGLTSVVLGISGGLDSTLAFLACLRTFDFLKIDRKNIVAVTMPGFGTTERTKTNAVRLAELSGVTLRSISIEQASRLHFSDIGHDENIKDIVYENTQARERTQILMDIAQQVGGIVVGTGDLSELALGWCTYNGDHMSMYGINSGIPKTLVRTVVEWAADEYSPDNCAKIIHDICATPVSPELLPPDEFDNISQKTESTIGPYILHDYFLFCMIRKNYPPKKIFCFADRSFPEFSQKEILKWLTVFYRRFFSQQFKRSAIPDGVKIGSVALSPRGDWRMPSDAESRLWLRELEEVSIEIKNTKTRE